MALRAVLFALGVAATGCIPSGVARSSMDPVFPTGAPMDPSGAMRLVSTPTEVRVVSAPSIREVSAAGVTRSGARSIPVDPYGPTIVDPESIARYTGLPSPHTVVDAPLPTITTAAELRLLVGRRDKRDALAAILGFSRDLGAPQGYAEAAGADVVTWASAAGRLGDPSTPAQPGDIVVFDRAVGDGSADLLALVVARDTRGVTEVVYLGNGIYRRGFVDSTRPRLRRDEHQRVVNTYLRHGKKWPPKGTRYLTGELIAYVIRMTP